jgi:hypothetical protein
MLGREPGDSGLAALRFWGESGQRPATFVAGADPVYLEPLLAGLRLHAFAPHDIRAEELRQLFDGLQQRLGDPGKLAFVCLGQRGYLQSRVAFATPPVEPEQVHGASAGDLLPVGDASDLHRLLGEIQMYLHEHPVNVARTAAGARPVNSLWIWGGGVAIGQPDAGLPPLFAAEPLFRGYWSGSNAPLHNWDGDLAACLQAAAADFVVVPDTAPGRDERLGPMHLLTQARQLMRRGALHRVSLLFANGATVALGRMDLFRFWRRSAPGLRSGSGHV